VEAFQKAEGERRFSVEYLQALDVKVNAVADAAVDPEVGNRIRFFARAFTRPDILPTEQDDGPGTLTVGPPDVPMSQDHTFVTEVTGVDMVIEYFEKQLNSINLPEHIFRKYYDAQDALTRTTVTNALRDLGGVDPNDDLAVLSSEQDTAFAQLNKFWAGAQIPCRAMKIEERKQAGVVVPVNPPSSVSPPTAKKPRVTVRVPVTVPVPVPGPVPVPVPGPGLVPSLSPERTVSRTSGDSAPSRSDGVQDNEHDSGIGAEGKFNV
jgi:hypothetical protein